MKRWPILSVCENLSKILLNSIKLRGRFCFFIQPYGRGLVLGCPYWLFPSIFNIFVETLFVCFLPSMSKSNKIFSFFLSSRRICVSKASLVFTQLKPPISVFFRNSDVFSFCWKSNHTFNFICVNTTAEGTG